MPMTASEDAGSSGEDVDRDEETALFYSRESVPGLSEALRFRALRAGEDQRLHDGDGRDERGDAEDDEGEEGEEEEEEEEEERELRAEQPLALRSLDLLNSILQQQRPPPPPRRTASHERAAPSPHAVSPATVVPETPPTGKRAAVVPVPLQAADTRSILVRVAPTAISVADAADAPAAAAVPTHAIARAGAAVGRSLQLVVGAASESTLTQRTQGTRKRTVISMTATPAVEKLAPSAASATTAASATSSVPSLTPAPRRHPRARSESAATAAAAGVESATTSTGAVAALLPRVYAKRNDLVFCRHVCGCRRSRYDSSSSQLSHEQRQGLKAVHRARLIKAHMQRGLSEQEAELALGSLDFLDHTAIIRRASRQQHEHNSAMHACGNHQHCGTLGRYTPPQQPHPLDSHTTDDAQQREQLRMAARHDSREAAHSNGDFLDDQHPPAEVGDGSATAAVSGLSVLPALFSPQLVALLHAQRGRAAPVFEEAKPSRLLPGRAELLAFYSLGVAPPCARVHPVPESGEADGEEAIALGFRLLPAKGGIDAIHAPPRPLRAAAAKHWAVPLRGVRWAEPLLLKRPYWPIESQRPCPTALPPGGSDELHSGCEDIASFFHQLLQRRASGEQQARTQLWAATSAWPAPDEGDPGDEVSGADGLDGTRLSDVPRMRQRPEEVDLLRLLLPSSAWSAECVHLAGGSSLPLQSTTWCGGSVSYELLHGRLAWLLVTPEQRGCADAVVASLVRAATAKDEEDAAPAGVPLPLHADWSWLLMHGGRLLVDPASLLLNDVAPHYAEQRAGQRLTLSGDTLAEAVVLHAQPVSLLRRLHLPQSWMQRGGPGACHRWLQRALGFVTQQHSDQRSLLASVLRESLTALVPSPLTEQLFAAIADDVARWVSERGAEASTNRAVIDYSSMSEAELQLHAEQLRACIDCAAQLRAWCDEQQARA